MRQSATLVIGSIVVLGVLTIIVGMAALATRTVTLGPGNRECPLGGGCAGLNDEPIPNVEGLPVEAACRTLEESDYGGQVQAVVNNGELEPGHVVAQEPEAGSFTPEGYPVSLVVNRALAEVPLTKDSACSRGGGITTSS